jgi:hypothetical protein
MKRAAIIILFIISALSLAKLNGVQAQATTWKFQSPVDFGGAIQGEDNNAQSTWFTGLQNSSYSITCLTGGFACSSDPLNTSYFQKSALGYLSNTIALTFLNKPANLGTGLADMGHSLGFIPQPVYAQGVGFSGMLPLLPIWKVFRNVAYLLMAVVMVVIGFMVMFRKKIDPKTVVTAQNAIPRVIIALILITFSYAIVGLAIDIMYVVLALTVTLFKATPYLPNGGDVLATNHLFKSLFNTEFNPFRILFNWNADTATAGWITGLTAAISGIAGFAYPGLWILTIASAIVPLIFYVALLFLYIRLLVFFITAYIQIILSLLIAPLQLLLECFPGSTAFSSWFKNLIANLAVFPIAAALFMLSQVFQELSKTSTPPGTIDTSRIWAPPFVGISTSTTAIASLISLGLLFAIPSIAGSVKEALKAKSTLPMDFGGAGGSAMNMMSTFYYLKMLAPSGLMKKIFPGQKEEQ